MHCFGDKSRKGNQSTSKRTQFLMAHIWATKPQRQGHHRGIVPANILYGTPYTHMYVCMILFKLFLHLDQKVDIIYGLKMGCIEELCKSKIFF